MLVPGQWFLGIWWKWETGLVYEVEVRGLRAL